MLHISVCSLRMHTLIFKFILLNPVSVKQPMSFIILVVTRLQDPQRNNFIFPFFNQIYLTYRYNRYNILNELSEIYILQKIFFQWIALIRSIYFNNNKDMIAST